MSDRYSPREAGRPARLVLQSSRPARANVLPDAPDNPEFIELPQAFQETLAQRFDSGILLTSRRNAQAYRAGQSAWNGWVNRCYQNRLRERDEARRERLQREAILEQNRRRVR